MGPFSYKDTSFFDDDVSCWLVEDHLVKNINDLTHHLIIFLFSCNKQEEIQLTHWGLVTSYGNIDLGQN